MFPSRSASYHNPARGAAYRKSVATSDDEQTVPAIVDVPDSTSSQFDKHLTDFKQASPCADWALSSESEKRADKLFPISKKMPRKIGNVTITRAMLN